jgi:hypothetical protein
VKNHPKIEVENVNHPGQLRLVDAAMYAAMKRAVLKVIPKGPPGLTVAALEQKVLAHLPQELFPNGTKAGWWTKTVQLDLEAKGILAREKMTPLRLHRAGAGR